MKNTLLLTFIMLALQSFGQNNHTEFFKSMRQSDLKGDINIYYDPVLDKYDVHFVKLNLKVSDETTYLSGDATLHVTAVKPLDTLVFDFCNYMTLDSIFINDKKINATHLNDKIEYIFDPPLSVNENIVAQIFYHGTPYEYGGVMNGYDSYYNKNVTFTLSESFHALEWWPCKQVLSDKIDSAYIFLTCDDDCMAGSNGLLDNVVDLSDNKKRFEWITYYPIDYYLISFSVAEYQDYSIYAKPDGIDSVLIQNYLYNNASMLPNNKEDIDATKEMLELYSDKFGLYPFANEKYGHCQTTLGGGMEHQTMTTIGSFGFHLVAHELGHMWFGDYVTCATWQDIWINEGFASYTEYVAYENLQSFSAAQNWMNSAHDYALGEPYGSVYIPFSQASNEARIFNYRLSYKKGAAIVHMLRHEVNNDELFFASLRNFLIEFGDSVATGEDFKNSLESYVSSDFDSFFEQWYYGQGYPQFDVGYKQLNDTLYMTVNQTTSSSATPLFQMHVDYKIVSANGDTTIRLYQGSNAEIYKIPFSRQVSNIIVDPDNWILKQQGSVTSVDKLDTTRSLFSFSPNPAIERVEINFDNKLHDKIKTIQIWDLNGRLIMSFSPNSLSFSIDVSNLSKGIYLLKGTSEKYSNTYKLIKQ